MLAPLETVAGVSGSAWGRLPSRLRVLLVTQGECTAAWLGEALASDSATHVELEEQRGLTAGLARLREQRFDAVLVSHEPPDLDGLDFVEGLRAGGAEEPFLVLGNEDAPDLAVLAYEAGADDYVAVSAATTRSLLWALARSIERQALCRENRRLLQAERHRLRQDHQEAERLLQEQRGLLRDLEVLHAEQGVLAGEAPISQTSSAIARHAHAAARRELPVALVDHYRALLRAYVIMGSGSLGGDLARLAELLVSAGVSAAESMQLHTHAIEDLLRGLGQRSARHVMARAELLVLEVLVHTSEGYRRRSLEFQGPPRQLVLPGMEEAQECLA